MKKVSKLNLFELQDSSSVIDENSRKGIVGGGDGSSLHPYTQREFGYIINSGLWNGGWVYGMGWVAPEVDIYSNRYSYSSGYYPFGHTGSSYWTGGMGGGGHIVGYPGHNGYNLSHNNYYRKHNSYWGNNGYFWGDGYHSYDGGDDNYSKINFAHDRSQIGEDVINAMRQFFVNHVGDMRDLVDYNSTRWGQGGAIRSDYFSYNGNEVQWTVVNGTAAANNYREVFSLSTSNLVQDPAYNNYEIQIKYSEGGTALRLQTRDYETYMALLDAVGYPNR